MNQFSCAHKSEWLVSKTITTDSKMVSASTYRGEVTDQLHLYHDAFAGTTASPKIPDGKAESSVGLHMQHVREIIGSTANGEMYIILFPGLGVMGRVAFSTQLNSQNAVVDFPEWRQTSQWTGDGFTSHIADYRITRSSDLAKWRMVSGGMQLKLVNAAEEDDGWWEAIRLHTDIRSEDWCLKAFNPPGLGDWSIGSHLVRQIPQDLIESSDKSYATGLLRDLGKVQFDLKPTYQDHEFITPGEAHNVETGAGGINGTLQDPTNANDVVFDPGSDVLQRMVRDATDQAFDSILIKIHGRPNTLSPTRLHANFVANYEAIYSRATDLSLFHTKSHDIGDAHMSMHRDANKNPSAANVIP